MNAEEIIAERKLIFISPDGNESLSSIQLGKPYSSDEHGYCCDIEIPNIKKRRFAPGVDAIQAIQLSIFMLASILDVMKNKGWKILWPDTRHETTAREIYEVDQFARIE